MRALRVLAYIVLPSIVAACASAEASGDTPQAVEGTPTPNKPATGKGQTSTSTTSEQQQQTPPEAVDPCAGDVHLPPLPTSPLPANCDDDNPVSVVDGSVDKELPRQIIQFERYLNWGCIHREWHEARQWDFLEKTPAQSARLDYAKKQGWKRLEVQEGDAGSGYHFLAMHRAMVGTLKAHFPEHAALFDGWTTVPTEGSATDPIVDGSPAFRESMKTANARIESGLSTFASEDEFGLYVETQHRPTPTDPLARSSDGTTGFHTYIHVRFDDARSAIRMQRFSRNLEGVAFFKLHGWIDRKWTELRTLKGLVDATDTKYAEEMMHACMHMGMMGWNATQNSCVGHPQK